MPKTYKPTAINVYVNGELFESVQFPCRWEPMAGKFDWAGIIQACDDDCVIEVEYANNHSYSIVEVQYCEAGCLINVPGSTSVERVPMASVWPMVRQFISCAVLRNQLNLTVSDDGNRYLSTPRLMYATPGGGPRMPYKVGDKVRYDGRIYVVEKDHGQGTVCHSYRIGNADSFVDIVCDFELESVCDTD